MGLSDYHNLAYWADDADGDDPQRGSGPHRCKYCNTYGLYWHQFSYGWRLVLDESLELHQCKLAAIDAGEGK